MAGLVDLKDVRVFQEEAATVIFELPLQLGQGDLSADKFQALFRVNKTQRGFEAITVKQRTSVRVSKGVTMVGAGMEVRFQTFDPALAPQPVFLKSGGGVRVLLVKMSRFLEATRTDFRRVVPFEEVK
jgi:hypothetical protein